MKTYFGISPLPVTTITSVFEWKNEVKPAQYHCKSVHQNPMCKSSKKHPYNPFSKSAMGMKGCMPRVVYSVSKKVVK